MMYDSAKARAWAFAAGLLENEGEASFGGGTEEYRHLLKVIIPNMRSRAKMAEDAFRATKRLAK
jgi:hypothetical protein